MATETEKLQSTSATVQLVVFKLGTEEYALKIGQIKEVVITPNITKVPLTAPFIKGVANIRGNIFAIVDLEERLGLESSLKNEEGKYANFTLVIENDQYKMGILVNEVPNTLNVPESNIDASPNIVQKNNLDENYIEGIIKIGNRLVILIDIYKIITKENVDI